MEDEAAIAVVGIGCMFPGAENIDEFWKVLRDGEDHVQDIPPERFNIDAYYDPDPDNPRKTNVRKAGLIHSYDKWDNRFFGINDMEAEVIDPQQHFVMETVHMALEDGGFTQERLDSSNTGVYIGGLNNDWGSLLRVTNENSRNTSVTSVDTSILSARVAYFYNLLGPALTINTACSSSMVAIDTAMQALKNGEISMAICGGVNVILDPDTFIGLSCARMASPTGKCHTFSVEADGYARGEGCGVVLLKRLTNAIHDKNKIWGTIYTKLNQDGHMSTPITSPSGKQQERLLEQIFKESKTSPSSVQYVEAHGTGTPIGDYIEVMALGSFFSKYCEEEIPIGSVKTNIGHLEAGAGMASLIKVLLMMKYGFFVPSLHAEILNPQIPFSACKMKVSHSLQKWSADAKGKRIASVNCFGYGGTNAHAIVRSHEESGASVQVQNMKSCLSKTFYVLLSAKDLSALFNTANHLLQFVLDNLPTVSMVDLSSTSIHFRSHYKLRKVFVVENVSKFVSEVEEFVQKKLHPTAAKREIPKMIFVYCGVGTTWPEMCKQLITEDKIFENTVREIDDHLSSYNDISLRMIFETGGDISDPLINHLSIFACQVGLTAMWKHLGIHPDAIIGQSVGEVAGAYAGGNLSLKDAVKVIYFRSLHLSETFGKMVLVQHCPLDVIEETCKHLTTGKANIAVYHSSVSCAVSGDTDAIEELKVKLANKSGRIIPLNVKCAYHSHLTKDASKMLEQILSGLEKKCPRTTIISTVTGQRADENFGSNSYWADNVFKPVHFQDALKEAKRTFPNSIFLEIGPSPVLRAHLSNIFPETVEEALPSMKRNNEIDVFRETFITIFENGFPVAWQNIVPIQKLFPCPKYQFSKRKYLVKSEKMKRILNGDEEYEKSSMLTRMRNGNIEQFTITLSRKNAPFIYAHTLDGNVVVPGALYGNIALELGTSIFLSRGVTEIDISWTIHRTQIIKDAVQPIVVKTFEKGDIVHFEAISNENQPILSTGTMKQSSAPRITSLNINRLISLLQNEKDTTNVYPTLQSLGFHHGELYQTIKKCVCRGNECICEVILPDEVLRNLNKAFFHPIIIDSMFQSCCGIHFQKKSRMKVRTFPRQVSCFTVRQKPSARMICYTVLVYENSVIAVFNILLLHTDGSIVAEVTNYKVTKIDTEGDIFSISYSETWNAISLPHLSVSLGKTLYLLSWNKEYLSLLEYAFLKRFRNSDIRCLTLSDNLEDQFSLFLKGKAEMRNFDVIYIPGLPGIETHTTGEELMNAVKQTTHYFLELVKILYEYASHTLVITNEAQACQSSQTRVIGAELWGMVRAVSQEGTQLSFTLLDIEDLNENSMNYIVKIITELDPGTSSAPSEYAVRQNVIYKNELKRMPDEFHQTVFKSGFPKKQENMCLRYNFDKGMPSYFAIPCVEDSSSLDVYCIRPTHALPCIPDTFFIQDNFIPEHYCSENRIKGFGITACEVVGITNVDGKELEVVAFGQIELKSEIRVDKKCVFEKTSLAGYSLGSLHAVIIALAIADLVEQKAFVFIDYSKKYSTVFHFLVSVLEEKKCILSCCETAYSKKRQNLEAVQLVVLSEEGYDDPHMFRLLFPNVQKCIFLKGRIPSIFMDHNLCFFDVINVADLFHPKCGKVTSLRKRLLAILSNDKKLDSPTPNLLEINEILNDIELRIPDEHLIRADSAYIVVGGMTGLGWTIVKYLSRRGAKIIVSLSRRSLSNENKKRIQNIKHLHGVDVIHKEVDICNLDKLTEVISCIKQQMPYIPIRGVFQGAVVLQDQTVLKMSIEDFDVPLMAKIKGTWNLHHLTKEMNLDFFILHSSASSIFGSHSQCNYAAANAFLDSFAFYRKSLGLPAQVINWGALEVGLGSDPKLKDFFFHKGINLMSVDKVYRVLTQMLLSDQTQGIIFDFDLKKFVKARGSKKENSKITDIVHFADVSILKELVNDKENNEPIQNFVDLVKKTSSQVLMVDISEITDRHTLSQFGLDSQNVVEFTNMIFSETSIRIPIVLLLSGELSVLEIAKFLSEKEMLRRESIESPEEVQSISKTMSVVEKHLKSFQDIYKNCSFVATFAISKSKNQPIFWENVVDIFCRMNPNLRVKSSENDSSLQDSNSIVDSEDFTCPFECVQTKISPGFVLQNTNDILYVIHEDVDSKAQLHISCNRVGLDVFCAKIILHDLQKIAAHILASQPVPAWFDKPNIDILPVYANKLHGIAEKCTEYWKNQLQRCKTPCCWKSNPKYSEFENKKLSIRIPKSLIEFAEKHDLTMFIIVCSAFQMTLNKITFAERISLLTEIDLRSQFAECRDVILPCANLIPLVSPNFEDSFVKVIDILMENKTVVEQCMGHCLLPFVEIMDLQEFDRSIHMKNYFVFDSLEDDDEQCIHLKSLEMNTDMDCETYLYAKHNLTKNTVELEFRFRCEFLSSVNTSSIVNFFLDFIQTLPENCNQTLGQIQLPAKSEESLALFPKGNILLIKNDGEKKQLFFELSGYPPSLSLGSERDTQIALSDIDDFHIFNVNGHPHLRLQLKGGKDVNFEESDNHSFQTLVSFLRKHLWSHEKQ